MKRLAIQFRAVIFSLLLFLVLATSGCALINRNGGEEENIAPAVTVFGDQATLGGDAILMCTQACGERGFCGTDPAGTTVVIMNSAGPATVNQDMTIPDNTPVAIFGVEKRDVMTVSTQELFAIDYYFVRVAENVQGWVSGWCIGQ